MNLMKFMETRGRFLWGKENFLRDLRLRDKNKKIWFQNSILKFKIQFLSLKLNF